MSGENICGCAVHGEKTNEIISKMPEEQIIYETGSFFKVLGDCTRIKILFVLLNRELCVGDIADCLNMSQSAVSHQLRVLRQSGFVKHRREGKAVIYSLDDEHIENILNTGLLHVRHKKVVCESCDI